MRRRYDWLAVLLLACGMAAIVGAGTYAILTWLGGGRL